MNKELTKEQEEELKKIDERIEDLEFHRKAWLNAGGRGYRMAEQAIDEIADLKVKKEDVINGTHNYEIRRIQKEIAELKREKAQAMLLEKIKYSKMIKQKNDELQVLKTKR